MLFASRAGYRFDTTSTCNHNKFRSNGSKGENKDDQDRAIRFLHGSDQVRRSLASLNIVYSEAPVGISLQCECIKDGAVGRWHDSARVKRLSVP